MLFAGYPFEGDNILASVDDCAAILPEDEPEPLDSEETEVTIAIAIATSTGIAMAADGQTTVAKSYRLPSKSKLHRVRFKDGFAVVGAAGNNPFSDLSLRNFGRIASKSLLTKTTIGRVLGSSIAASREEIRAQNFGCAATELNAIIKDHDDCELLVACFAGGPKLLKVRLSHGTPSVVAARFAAIGSGRRLAEYLLPYTTWAGMNVAEAEMAAIYVVEEVKKQDLFCSGKTRAALVGSGVAVLDGSSRVADMVRASETTSKMIRTAVSRIFQSRFDTAFRNFARAVKQMDAYVKKHPEVKNMTVKQVGQKMEAERLSKRV